MHPLTKLIKDSAWSIIPELEIVIQSWAKERADFLKSLNSVTDSRIDQAFQLEPEVCEKCGQVIKEPQ